MKRFAVWERAYGRENATVYEAWTHKGAVRKYRKELGFLGAMGWAELF